ncbi:uncharacterized protein LOC126765938 [Bactrocera neohumeralis]|uniref:uncharacterized protein LOC120778719 n=1 Tax=Bactrocera tryoni TaxID=59916 RepID=UPI001A971970|nr:uncharacterized protein LOC120778719 [Bactrocera tryoni]XP_050339661.1 uncharacterized protein LOC126765938 [Bactrocera neohumeralis]
MRDFVQKMLTFVALLLLSVLTIQASPLYYKFGKYGRYNIDPLLASASNEVPMVQSNNFDMIMADDKFPTDSIKYQNFASFHEPKMTAESDFSMDETQFLPKNTPIRAPQAVSKQEREIRQRIEVADPKLEKKKMLKLKKGSSVPRGADAYAWDQFDYDLYSVNPSNQKKFY